MCDRVDIADVDGRTTPVMSSFCGSTVPNDIFTVNNRVLVYFRTDGFTIGSGFRIYYSSKFPAQGNANRQYSIGINYHNVGKICSYRSCTAEGSMSQIELG